jgi:prenylated cyclic peptide (anacyclamide/piricyclamide family)
MTKKNLKPQQAAPVQREINTTSSVGGTGLTPQIGFSINKIRDDSAGWFSWYDPFSFDSNIRLKKY